MARVKAGKKEIILWEKQMRSCGCQEIHVDVFSGCLSFCVMAQPVVTHSLCACWTFWGHWWQIGSCNDDALPDLGICIAAITSEVSFSFFPTRVQSSSITLNFRKMFVMKFGKCLWKIGRTICWGFFPYIGSGWGEVVSFLYALHINVKYKSLRATVQIKELGCVRVCVNRREMHNTFLHSEIDANVGHGNSFKGNF